MHYPQVLKKFGCTPERLREIFTSKVAPETPAQVSLDRSEVPKQPKSDADIRRRFESRIRSRLIDGIGNNLRMSRPNQAVDMAWDAPPIQRDTIPYLLWAQGKIKLEGAGGFLEKICDKNASPQQIEQAKSRWFSKGEGGSLKLNTARISEVSIDLMKSYITRRHAAINALWSNLWPLLKYDTRGTDDVSQLRGDALTQRVDIMSDDYNYRHFFGQARRFMLLYGYSVAFPRAGWDRKIGWRAAPTNTGEPTDEVESYVEREGVQFVLPHPSRIGYDLSASLADINTDTGPSFIFYWDVQRYGTLLEPSADFWNINHIFVSDGWIELATQFSDFFFYYFDPKVISWPNTEQIDPTLDNDRQARIGRYTSEGIDQGILLTHYFEKINPLVDGSGTYDADVWIHLTVAGDCTVIGGEFLPSRPAVYGAINWNDNRLSNQSMGMSLLGYQDQSSNIVTQMIQQLRSSYVQLWLIDKDSLEPAIREEIEKNAMNANWWVDPKFLLYSATKLKDLGIMDPSAAFRIIQNNIPGIIENALKALNQLLNLADRLLILSPNELGQPNPREISAREVSDIATSVQAMYSFINEGPREQMAAAKELIYESLICCGTESFRVPVLKRYSKAVVEKAGMKIPDDVIIPEDDIVPAHTPILGNLRDLVYDYYFDSRDGAERVLNTQGAQVVMQLLQTMIQIPPLAQKMGVKAIYDFANIVIRMSGAPVNFQFDVPVGGDDKLPQDNEEKQDQTLKVVMGQLQRIEQVMMQTLHIPAQVFQVNGGGAQPPPNGEQPPSATGPAPAAPPPPNGAAPEPSPAQLLQEPSRT
jgi:hypothetical protein